MQKAFSAVLLLILVYNSALGQNIEFNVPKHQVGITLTNFLNELEAKEKVKFFSIGNWTDHIIIKTSYRGQKLSVALNDILRGRQIEWQYVYDYGILLMRNLDLEIKRKALYDSLKTNYKTITIGDSTQANWDDNVFLRGNVIDEKFEDALEGITIVAHEINKIVSTDVNGNYSFELPVGKHIISFRGLNYQEQFYEVRLYASGNLNCILIENPLTLEEIVIKDNTSAENFEDVIAGRTRITAQEIQQIPAFLGEVDVIKSIQSLPGVNTIGEGSAGFNVRGGSPDQNLILLDNGIVFNPNHLFGFFSAFHPDAVKDVTFYRGVIPAEFGGRVSSVLDVKQKDGDLNTISGNGGIGIVSSRLLLEGPISKDKISFLFAGRTSYSDWLLRRIPDENVRNSEAFFYDLTAKMSAFLNKNNKLSISAYTSYDQFKFANDTTYYWRNKSLSVSHEKIFNRNFSLFSKISGGEYTYDVQDKNTDNSFSWDYGIRNIQLKSYGELKKNKHRIKAGIDITNYQFRRGSIVPLGINSNIEPLELDDDNSLIVGLFASDEFRVKDKLTVTAGIRLSNYFLIGEHNEIIYDENEAKSDITISDTIRYSTGEIAETYLGFEPRFTLKYSINSGSFFKAGFTRTFQYIHLLSNTTAITPIDSWVPSTTYLEPQIGNQYSIGFFKDLPKNKLRASVELFFKNIENVPEYIDGAELALKQNIETELVNSEADIRGLEFSLQKRGRLSGELNYTYTSSRRRTNSSFSETQINNNELFPSNFDQPHNFKLLSKYEISRRYAFSVNFNVASGRPLTAPTERFIIDGTVVGNFSERNQFRIPTYHRLDASLLIRTNLKKNKKWEGSWSITVYNIYSRRNAYSIFFQENERGVPEAFRLSILGSIFPTLTYNFKF